MISDPQNRKKRCENGATGDAQGKAAMINTRQAIALLEARADIREAQERLQEWRVTLCKARKRFEAILDEVERGQGRLSFPKEPEQPGRRPAG